MDLRAEKIKILQMVGDGKVSVAEGEMLLDALGIEPKRAKSAPSNQPAMLQLNAETFRRFHEEEVSPQFIQAALQIPTLSADDVLRLWEEEADLDVVRQLVEHGLDQRLSKAQMAEVASEGTPLELIKAVAALDKPYLEPEQLVEIMIERADTAVIEAINRLQLDYLEGQHLVELAGEKVQVELLQAVSELTAVDFEGHHLVELATERVNPEQIRALAAAHIEGLTGDQVVEFALEGINPELLAIWQVMDAHELA
ncbi:MAG: hypothetical protein AAF614_39340 [Chloroflexota bacterium]